MSASEERLVNGVMGDGDGQRRPKVPCQPADAAVSRRLECECADGGVSLGLVAEESPSVCTVAETVALERNCRSGTTMDAATRRNHKRWVGSPGDLF